MVKNVDTFCPYLKSLPQPKVKRFRLIALTKEVPDMPMVDFVLWLNLDPGMVVKILSSQEIKPNRCLSSRPACDTASSR